MAKKERLRLKQELEDFQRLQHLLKMLKTLADDHGNRQARTLRRDIKRRISKGNPPTGVELEALQKKWQVTAESYPEIDNVFPAAGEYFNYLKGRIFEVVYKSPRFGILISSIEPKQKNLLEKLAQSSYEEEVYQVEGGDLLTRIIVHYEDGIRERWIYQNRVVLELREVRQDGPKEDKNSERDPNTAEGFMNLVVRAHSDSSAHVSAACELWMMRRGFPEVHHREESSQAIVDEMKKAFRGEPHSEIIVSRRIWYNFNSLLARMENPTPERLESAIKFLKSMAMKFGVDYEPELPKRK